MAITITLIGTDLKIVDGTDIEYLPFSEVKQIPVGTRVELYRNGELVRGDQASEYASPSGTAEQICDGISSLADTAAFPLTAKDVDGNTVNLIASPEGYLGINSIDYEIGMGRVPNKASGLLLGYNIDLDANGGNPQTIWSDPSSSLWVIQPTAATYTIVSDNTNDSAAGTGAQTLVLIGIDENKDEQTVVIALDGTTPVVTTEQWLGLNFAAVAGAGSSLTNEGIITIDATAGTQQGYMAAGDSTTNQAIYHTPNNRKFALRGVIAVAFKAGSADTGITLNGYYVANGVRQRIYFVVVESDVYPESKQELMHPFVFERGSYFYVEAIADTNNSQLRLATQSTVETIVP